MFSRQLLTHADIHLMETSERMYLCTDAHTCSHKEDSCPQDDVPFTLIETTSSNAHPSHQQQDGTEDREDVGSPDYPCTEDRVMVNSKNKKGNNRTTGKYLTCLRVIIQFFWEVKQRYLSLFLSSRSSLSFTHSPCQCLGVTANADDCWSLLLEDSTSGIYREAANTMYLSKRRLQTREQSISSTTVITATAVWTLLRPQHQIVAANIFDWCLY